MGPLQAAAAPLARPPPGSFPLVSGNVTLQPRIVRSKTGCLTCRSRRKKCDERKPTCMGCARNKLECQWPSASESASSSTSPPPRSSCPKRAAKAKPLTAPAALARSSTDSALHRLGSDSNGTVTPRASSEDALALGSPPPELPKFPSFMRDARTSPLLHHWIEVTAPRLSAHPSAQNPLVSNVLPLAQTDSILFHVIMSIAGIDLNARCPNPNIKYFALAHQSVALRKLRNALAGHDAPSLESPLALPLTVLLLRLFEALYGNSRAAIASHLEASKRLIRATSPKTMLSDDEKGLYGFLIQYHALMTMADHFSYARDIVLGPNDAEPLLKTLSNLQQYRLNGSLDAATDVFELVPLVHELGARLRMAAAVCPLTSNNTDLITYLKLEAKLLRWADAEDPSLTKARSHVRSVEQEIAGRIWHHASMCFLYVVYYAAIGDMKACHRAVEPWTRKALDLAPSILYTPVALSLLWPCMVVGSCLVHPEDQQAFSALLKSSPFWHIEFVQRIYQIVEMVWDDAEETTFGPAGTEKVMMENGIDFVSA